MRRNLLVLLILLCCPLWLAAQELQLPALSGRVVDEADLIDPQAESRLSSLLAAHEQASGGEQLVVVTLPDLQGRSIEAFGVALGRAWGIGQQGEDNGALLIVAPAERQVRIEVGYGLEGRLTDAQSALIINRILLPAFRQGDFERGIVQATEAMIRVLDGEVSAEAAPPPVLPLQQAPPPAWPALLFLLAMLVVVRLLGGGRRGRGGVGRGLLLGALLGGMGRGAGLGGGGGFGGGGFGGGGGGFGGGGASGGW